MRKSKFGEHQIIAILKAAEAGRAVKHVYRQHVISDATYHSWRAGCRYLHAGLLEATGLSLKPVYVDCLVREWC